MTTADVWNTIGRNRGQIVEHSEAQTPGCAEGTCRRSHRSLHLRLDRADMSWSITDGRRELRGTGSDIPSPGDAVHQLRR